MADKNDLFSGMNATGNENKGNASGEDNSNLVDDLGLESLSLSLRLNYDMVVDALCAVDSQTRKSTPSLNLQDVGLPSPKPTVPELPTPKPLVNSGLPTSEAGFPSLKPTIPELPTPKPLVNSGMPTSKPLVNSGMPAPEADLPSLKSTIPELPTPKPLVNSGMPAPEADLPSLKSTIPELPTPKPLVNSGMPAPEADLPSPKSAVPGLPSPKSAVPGLPSPKSAVPGLPSPKSSIRGVPIHSPGEAARHSTVALSPKDLVMQQDASSAYGLPSHEKSNEDSSLDMPRLKLGEDAQQPVLKLEHGAPTGAFSNSNEFDDNSGLPLTDDPLGIVGTARSGVSKADAARNDIQMQSENAVQTQQENDILGLFEQPELSSPSERNNGTLPIADPVGPTLPLQSSLPPVPRNSGPGAAGVPPLPKNGVGLRGMNGQQPPLQGAAMANAATGDMPTEDEGELVFDVKSIQSGGSVVLPFKSVEKSKLSGTKRARRKRLLIVIGAVGGICLCVLAALGKRIYDEKTYIPDNSSIAAEPEKVDVRWDLAFLDRDIAYKTFFETSIKRLHQNDIASDEKTELQGKALINIVLASAHHPNMFTNDDLEMMDNSAKSISTSCLSDWCAVGLYSWGLFRNNDEFVAGYKTKLPKTGELASLASLVQLSVAYYRWNEQEQTYSQRLSEANNVLKIADSVENITQYPLAVWIKASTLMRIGDFASAASLLSSAKTEDGKPKSVALALLEIDVDYALDKVVEAAPLIEFVKDTDNLSPENQIEVKQRELIYLAMSKDTADFLQSLEEFVKANASTPQLLFASFQACSYMQVYSDCLSMYTRVANIEPTNIDLRAAQVAVYLLKQGISELIRPDQVLTKPIFESINAVLSKGLQEAPQKRILWELNAALQYAARKDADAVKSFDEVERGKEVVWFGAFLRQLMDFDNGDEAVKSRVVDSLRDSAKIVWKPVDSIVLAKALQYVGNIDEAKSLIERVQALYPADTDVLVVRFQLALETKDLEMAQDSARRLKLHRALQPNDEYQLAKLIEDLGDGSRALEQMLDLISRVKDNSEFLLYVGTLFFKQNLCDSAMPYFTQSIDLNTNIPETHFYKGRCLYQAGKYEEALSEFSEAGTQDETNHTYALWSGLGLQKIGQSNDAIKAFSAVIDEFSKIAPEARTPLDIQNGAWAYYYRASLRKIGKLRNDAYGDFTEAIKLLPNEPVFREGFIVALYESNRIDECLKQIASLEENEGIAPNSKILFIKGVVFLKNNQRKEALVALEAALNEGFADLEDSGIIGVREPAEIYERLGYLYRDMGKRDEARKYLSLLLEKSKTLSPAARSDIQNDIDKI